MYIHMYSHRRVLPLILALGSTVLAAELPTEWIDAATGHRVIRLSREDGTQSLYFNQNAYTADGKKLIVTTAGGGIATIDLATREVKPLVAGPASVLVAGHRTGDVYYTKRLPGGQAGPAGGRNTNGAIVYATNVNTGATREVVKLPPGRNVASLNADETLLLGTYVDGAAPPAPGASRPAGAGRGFRSACLGGGGRGRQADDLRGCQRSAAAQLVDGHARRCTARPVHGECQDGRTEGYLPGARVAGSSAVLAGRRQPHHVLPRRHVARGGPHLDRPRRRHRPDQDSHANHEHGNRRPRILLLGWRHDLVRPANAARPGFLAGRLPGGDGQAHLVSPGAQ